MPKSLSAFIWHFLKKHKISQVIIVIITIIASLEISLAPYILKLIIDTAGKNFGTNGQLLNAILSFATIYVLLTIIHNAAMRLLEKIYINLFPKLRTEIYVAMFEHLSKHSLAYFQQNFSGDLANKINGMAEGIENIVKIGIQYILGNFFTITISFLLLCTVHAVFAIILLAWIVIYVFSGYRLSVNTTLHANNLAAINNATLGKMVDRISNIVSMKIFSNAVYESKIVTEDINAVGEIDIALQKQIMKTHAALNLIYTALIILLLSFLIQGRMQGWVTVGDFAFILSLSITIATMVNGLNQIFPTLSREIGKCQQALNAIVIPYEVTDQPDARNLQVTNGTIKFKGVNFAYNKKKILFHNLDINISSKTKIVLVGFSGGGKTTFINLILRLYDIQSGSICIDDQNIKSITNDSLMKNIALIPQQSELFNRSIMDNIRYGKIDALDAEVYAAAKQADCHSFIEQLPDGYDSLVGERGVNLSGGQRQRIAIARAILKQAPILILDEATAALDSVTEKEIQDSMEKIMHNKTVLVIAHRLATILKMDRILFFKDGTIVEDGTINELLENKNGDFYRFWAMQMGTLQHDI
jgi:ATP-binding cassette subfamily B protein